MTIYKIRYGRVVNLGNDEKFRIEVEEEFDERNMPDRQRALEQVAKMVEAFASFRKKYPHKYLSGHMHMPMPLND